MAWRSFAKSVLEAFVADISIAGFRIRVTNASLVMPGSVEFGLGVNQVVFDIPSIDTCNEFLFGSK